VLKKIQVLWNGTLCRLVNSYRRFERIVLFFRNIVNYLPVTFKEKITWTLFFVCLAAKMKVLRYFEDSVTIYQLDTTLTYQKSWISNNVNVRYSHSAQHITRLFPNLVRSQNCEKRLSASSCLSDSPHATTRFPLDGFPWNFTFEYFSKIRRENSSFIKTDKHNGYFTWRPMYIYDNISLNPF
jgi:hypothetical protein